jgi:hypothetical protein
MRNTLLTTAALLGLALSAPAFAQSAPADPSAPATDASPPSTTPDSPAPAPHKMMHYHHKMAASGDDQTFAHQPGTGESGPASMKASNIDQADSRSDIAPHFPTPKVGHDATADAYLGDAERALKAHRTGEAQQALEMAETRLLDRSTLATNADQPAHNPQVEQISMARQALGHGDSKGATNDIKLALASNADAGQPGSGAGGMGNASDSGMSQGMSPGMSQGMMNHGGMSGTTSTNTAPTGQPMMAPSGAGPVPGASAGSSVGGGAAGTGTADSAGGAK